MSVPEIWAGEPLATKVKHSTELLCHWAGPQNELPFETKNDFFVYFNKLKIQKNDFNKFVDYKFFQGFLSKMEYKKRGADKNHIN